MSEFLGSAFFPTLLASWYAKGLLILAIVSLSVLLVRHRNPTLAASVTSAAVVGVLLLPLMSLLLPDWRVEVPGWQDPGSQTVVATAPAAPQSSYERPPSLALPRGALIASHSGEEQPPGYSGGANPLPRPAPAAEQPARVTLPSAATLIMLIWLIGALIVLDRQLRAHTNLNRCINRALPASAALQRLLEDCAQRLALHRIPRCVISHEVNVPLVCGWRNPVVVLPRSAQFWSEERLRVILTHELCHLRRGDWQAQQVARIACALHWPNPFIWWLERQLHLQRERACDAEVVAQGACANRYAEHLVAIARRAVRADNAPTMAPAAVGGSDLEERIMTLIHGKGLRRSTLASLLTGAALTITLAACAVVEPIPEAQASDTPMASDDVPVAPAAITQESRRPAPPRATTAATEPRAPAAPAPSARPEPATAPHAPLAPHAHRAHPHGDGRYHLGDDLTLWVDQQGPMRLSGDPVQIESMDAGSRLELETRDGQRHNRLVVTPAAGGALNYAWQVDGEARPFDADGERWLAAALHAWSRIERAENAAARISSEVQRHLTEDNAEFMEMQAQLSREMAELALDDGELQAIMAEIQAEAAHVAEQVASIQPDQEELAELSMQMASLALRQVDGRLNDAELREMESLQQALEARGRALEERMQAAEFKVDEQRMQALEARMQARMEAIDYEEKTRALEAKAQELEALMADSDFEQRMREMEKRVEAMQRKGDFAGLDRAVEELRGAIANTRS